MEIPKLYTQVLAARLPVMNQYENLESIVMLFLSHMKVQEVVHHTKYTLSRQDDMSK